MKKLDETLNFLRLYMHHCGRSEIPDDYHLWSGLFLVSCCLGNRVWYQGYKITEKPLYPNLYIILYGPSGIGKNAAIDTAMKFIDSNPTVNFYNGKISRAALIDYMAKPKRRGEEWIHDSNVILTTPELSYSFDSGPLADDMVKFLTQMFTAGKVERDATRSHGPRVVYNPCINWIAGTDEKWMLQSISPHAIQGGFFARTIIPMANYNFEYREPNPWVPPDYDEVREHLQWRVEFFLRIHGQFIMSHRAKEIYDDWYDKRHAPVSEEAASIWTREPSIVVKVAMLLSMTDMVLWDNPNPRLVIEEDHIIIARRMISEARIDILDLLNVATTTPDRENFFFVKRTIQRAKKLSYSTLLSKVSKRGITADLTQRYLRTLVQAEEITIEKKQKGDLITWREPTVGGS